jgi:hypothetical protein
MCRPWQALLLLLAITGVLVIYSRSAQGDDVHRDLASDFVHLQ